MRSVASLQDSASNASDVEEVGSGDDDDGDAEATGSEDDDGEDEPETFAPSGHAIHENHTQTGLLAVKHQTLGLGAGKKRKMSSNSSDYGEVKRPRKELKQHNDLTPDSDDEGYEGVDRVGDSDEDDPCVERLEEKWIIDSEEGNSSPLGSPVIPNAPSSVSSGGWPGLDLDVPFFDEEISRVHSNEFANEVDIFNDARVFDCESPSPSPPPRKVRFADEVYGHSNGTSSDDSSVEESPFPDLFLQQDRLDPKFRQIIENDDDEEQYITDGEGSYLAFDDNVDFGAHNHGLHNESSSSGGSSSGYESGFEFALHYLTSMLM